MDPFRHRIVGDPNNLLVPREFQVHLFRVLTYSRPRMSSMPFKAISTRDIFGTQEILA
jgi:hypothetical protein